MKIIIDDLSALNPKPNQFVGIDLEIFTNKGDEKHLHRPHTGKFACLSVCDDPTDIENSRRFVYTKSDYVSPVLEKLQSCVWVMQNGKFDITHLRRWAKVLPRKKYFDTMFCERILYNGYYDSFSLKSLARRHLGIELSKEARETFTGATELTREQIEYAANDPFVTLQIALKQKKLMDEDDRRIWTEIDMPAMWAFLDFQGFAINVDGWRALTEKHVALRDECDAKLPINPRSPQQVTAFLRQKGFKTIKNAQADHIEKELEKHPDTEAAQWAEIILQGKWYSTLSSKYGFGFIENFLEYDGDIPIIFTSYDVNRAETGRTASSDPPMQNIPVRKIKDYRYQFIARPGNKLVIADYSAQEPRLTALITKDEILTNLFRSGKDVYIELAKQIFGKDITKKDPERQKMKSVFLGMDYGMSEYGLAERENISKEEARELIKDTMRLLPNVANWMDEQQKEKTRVVTPFGRKIYLNRWSSQCERNAYNGPHQGGAGDITKKSLGKIHQGWDAQYPFAGVGFYHDELVFDVPEKIANDVAHFVKETMEQTANEMVGNYIPFIADTSVGNTWADK